MRTTAQTDRAGVAYGRRSRLIPPLTDKWVDSANTHMLLQDFDSRTLPRGGEIEPYVLIAHEIDGSVVERSLTQGLRRTGVGKFVRSVATQLLVKQDVWFEITFGDPKNDEAPFGVWEVNGVFRDSSGRILQKIPHRSEIPDWFDVGDEYGSEIELDSEFMVTAAMPDAYRGDNLSRIVQELAKIPLNPMPNWVIDGIANPNVATRAFGPSEVLRVSRLHELHVAAPIGWPVREGLYGPGRQINEFYLNLRELRFLHFVASMREQAEGALREVLEIAGRRCGFEATVMAHGMYTPDEVSDFIRQLEAGELPFSTLTDIIFRRGEIAESFNRRVV